MSLLKADTGPLAEVAAQEAVRVPCHFAADYDDDAPQFELDFLPAPGVGGYGLRSRENIERPMHYREDA